MKKLLMILAILAIIAGVGMIRAEAATTDTIAVTVTLQNISVDVTPPAWALGIKAPSSTTPQACTATNDGNVNENLDIAVSNSAPWTAGAAAGADVFAMNFSLTGAAPWTNITNAGVNLKTNLAPGAQAFTLQFIAPSSSSVTTERAITVTVSAAAA